jgi:tetratricopeptide (TPR) repeat protein
MNPRVATSGAVAVLLAAGFIGVWKLQENIDQERTVALNGSDGLTFRSPRVLKAISLEYAPLLGAMYWTRAVQYYGDRHRLHERSWPELWPLLDIATTLDPKMLVAYRFGATFLSDSPPRGAGEPDKAVELLERGVRENPDYWRFYQDLGNVYYFDKKDYLKASQAFETGSEYPGAPPFMKVMAAKIAAEGESLETSYALWLDIYQTTTDKEIRKNAEEHLQLVKSQIDLRELNRLADEYVKKNRRRPESMLEMAQAGLLRAVPFDPVGFPYVIDKEGKAQLNPKSPLQEELKKLQMPKAQM